MKVTLSLILAALALTATESYADHAPRTRQNAPRAVRTKPANPPAATTASQRTRNDQATPSQTSFQQRWDLDESDAVKRTPCMYPVCGGVYAASPANSGSNNSAAMVSGRRRESNVVESAGTKHTMATSEGTQQTPNPTQTPSAQNLVQGNYIGTDAARMSPAAGAGPQKATDAEIIKALNNGTQVRSAEKSNAPLALQEKMQSENR